MAINHIFDCELRRFESRFLRCPLLKLRCLVFQELGLSWKKVGRWLYKLGSLDPKVWGGLRGFIVSFKANYLSYRDR
jgi:hypothetical protein